MVSWLDVVVSKHMMLYWNNSNLQYFFAIHLTNSFLTPPLHVTLSFSHVPDVCFVLQTIDHVHS